MMLLEKAILSLYSDLDWLNWLHVKIRLGNIPMREIDQCIPRAGEILEIGCGHGLVANSLAMSSATRQVLGIDISHRRIACALSTVGQRHNIAFKTTRFLDLRPRNYDAIILSDVLYLMDTKEQRQTLESCYSQLKESGICLIKTVNYSSRWTKLRLHLQERIMKDLLHLTQGSRNLAFREMEEWEGLLRSVKFDFQAKTIPPTRRLITNPSWLFYCRKRPR